MSWQSRQRFCCFHVKEIRESIAMSFTKAVKFYFEEERYREAVIQFGNALQLDATFLPARLELARAYQKVNEHQNAVIELQRILEPESRHQQANLELGKYLFQAGGQNPDNYPRAQQFAEELLEDDPNNPGMRIYWAMLMPVLTIWSDPLMK